MGYRSRCLERKPTVCAVCGDDSTIEVHHVDGDRSNNAIENLLPVCTGCHNSIHSGASEYRMWRRAFGEFAQSDADPRVVPGDRVDVTVSLTSETLAEIHRLVADSDHSRSSLMRNIVRIGLGDVDKSGSAKGLVPREMLEDAEDELTRVRAEKRELEHCVRRLETLATGEIGTVKDLKAEKRRLKAQNKQLREKIRQLEDDLERVPAEYHRLKKREDLKNELYVQFSQAINEEKSV